LLLVRIRSVYLSNQDSTYVSSMLTEVAKLSGWSLGKE
jgi:hypothetical protein